MPAFAQVPYNLTLEGNPQKKSAQELTELIHEDIPPNEEALDLEFDNH